MHPTVASGLGHRPRVYSFKVQEQGPLWPATWEPLLPPLASLRPSALGPSQAHQLWCLTAEWGVLSGPCGRSQTAAAPEQRLWLMREEAHMKATFKHPRPAADALGSDCHPDGGSDQRGLLQSLLQLPSFSLRETQGQMVLRACPVTRESARPRTRGTRLPGERALRGSRD